jgi:membrane-bound lytic murein transglycosylase D
MPRKGDLSLLLLRSDCRVHSQILTYRRAAATNLDVRPFVTSVAIWLAIAMVAEVATGQASSSTPSGQSSAGSSGRAPSVTATGTRTPEKSRKKSAKASSGHSAQRRSGAETRQSSDKPARSARSDQRKTDNRTPLTGTAAERKGSKDSAAGDSTQSDPELAALDRAEKALFPWALRGIRSSFSFADSPLGYAPSPATTDANLAPPPAWAKDLSLPAIFPNVDGRILTYLEFYRTAPEGKAILRAWAKKRGRYESAIVATLAKAGVPTELVWQSLVESGHNPTTRSPTGAAGLWQFMPETARIYGLTVDRWIDERLDPERATIAAARLMADLFQRFGNWELALAAYNMGDAGLLRAIRKYNTNDFWTLSRYEAGLPMETALYVPRVIALTIAMQNPRAFGIDDVTPDDKVEFDMVTVGSGQLLSAVARVISVSDEQLARMNPHLLAQRTPPSSSPDKALGRIFVPKGLGELVRTRIGRLLGLEPDLTAYTIKNGETLEFIANARGVPVESLRTINRATNDERFESGTTILVPRQSSEPIESKGSDEDRVVVVPPDSNALLDERRVFYEVRSGDTLSSIADTFHVKRADLLNYNSIDTSARLQPRMWLQVHVSSSAQFERSTCFEEKDVMVLVAGSPEFIEYFEGLRGNERIVVQAKDKETLASIGNKYGVSIGMMERINRRSRRDVLTPGENVVVYARRKGNQERVTASR